MGYGTITSHALMSLEARGTLFVTPGAEVISVSSPPKFFSNYIQYQGHCTIPCVSITVLLQTSDLEAFRNPALFFYSRDQAPNHLNQQVLVLILHFIILWPYSMGF